MLLSCDNDSGWIQIFVFFLGGWQGLMRDLELREKKMNGVQATGDKLLRDGHPAKKTIEVRLI